MLPSVLTSISIVVSVVTSRGRRSRYLMRRPLKKPLFVVFCLIFAVWPCSAGFTSACLSASLDGISEWSPGPFWLWFAGGTGGMCPCLDIESSLNVEGEMKQQLSLHSLEDDVCRRLRLTGHLNRRNK